MYSLGNECANIGSVRLVNGSSEFEGRVELCYLGYWNSICQYDMEASVLCHELGFSTSGKLHSLQTGAPYVWVKHSV